MLWQYIAVFALGTGVGFVIMGQLVGWWARRHGAAYVINHLHITKP